MVPVDQPRNDAALPGGGGGGGGTHVEEQLMQAVLLGQAGRVQTLLTRMNVVPAEVLLEAVASDSLDVVR